MTPFVDMSQLRALLHPLLSEHPGGAILFDADGTLWAHDVGHITFDYACRNELLREDARDALLAEAQSAGVVTDRGWSLGQIGLALSEAFALGNYDEKTAAEMMVWAYAGWTEEEFRDLIRGALAEARHDQGVHRNVSELAAWARALGAATFIVSASPRWVVEEAAASLGFPRENIAGGVPRMDAGRMAVGMAQPLPYGPTKVIAGRTMTGSKRWLLALGDSGFDVALLAASQIGVGIGEKSALLAGIADLPNAYRLTDP